LYQIAVCVPVLAIVDEEVGDIAECFELDGVVERHGGGNDGEIMSSGNKGGGLFLCGVFLLCNGVGFVLGFGRIWQLVSVCVSFFVRFFSCAR